MQASNYSFGNNSKGNNTRLSEDNSEKTTLDLSDEERPFWEDESETKSFLADRTAHAKAQGMKLLGLFQDLTGPKK